MFTISVLYYTEYGRLRVIEIVTVYSIVL